MWRNIKTETFGRKVVDQQAEGGEEHTGRDDVDDVEEGLSLNDEEENHLLVLQLVFTVLTVNHLFGRPVSDDPLSIL